MGRANRGKIKERLTKERKSNHELKEKVKNYETKSAINRYKLVLSVSIALNIVLNATLETSVVHMATGVFIGAH